MASPHRHSNSGIQIFHQPYARARELARIGAPVYLSVNPVEYHGPHLSLHNDQLISDGLIRDLHAHLAPDHTDWPLLLAGQLEIGVETAPGPGSRPVPFSQACRLVRRTCCSLLELGVRRVVLMTFHGSPLHNLCLDKGARLLERHGVQVLTPMNVVFQLLMELDQAEAELSRLVVGIEDPLERRAVIDEVPGDIHAGFVETSLSLHYAPDTVSDRYRAVPPCPPLDPDRRLLLLSRLLGRAGRTQLARELLFLAKGLAWYRLRPFPGYTGRPHLANSQSGALLSDALVERIAACASEVFSGRARGPRPVLRWMELATLGGRLGQSVYDVEPVELRL